MHHTKTKADVGLAQVIADLAIKGIVPCIPLSEHQPYDLVAVTSRGRPFKMQVKFASLLKNGCEDVSILYSLRKNEESSEKNVRWADVYLNPFGKSK